MLKKCLIRVPLHKAAAGGLQGTLPAMSLGIAGNTSLRRFNQKPNIRVTAQCRRQLLTNIYINLCSGAMVLSECPEGPVGTGLSNSLLEQDKFFHSHSRQAAIYITGKTATLNDTSWN